MTAQVDCQMDLSLPWLFCVLGWCIYMIGVFTLNEWAE